MIEFGKLTVENFRSIGHAETNLRNRGLVLIVGEVLGSKMSDANGAGKSSLALAVLWCLYGKLIKSRGVDEVINIRAGKNCRVSLELIRPDGVYTIVRHRKYSRFGDRLVVLRGDVDISEEDPQAQVNKLMGMGVEPFLHTAFFGQGAAKRFTTCSSGERNEVMEALVGTARFRAAAESLAKSILICERVAAATKLEVAKAEARAEEKQTALDQLRDAAAQVEQRRQDARADAQQALDAALRACAITAADYTLATERVTPAQTAFDEADLALTTALNTAETHQDLQAAVATARQNCERLTTDIQGIRTKLAGVGKPGAECEECGRAISEHDAAAYRAKLQADLDTRLALQPKAKAAFDTATTNLRTAQTAAAEKLTKLRNARSVAERALREANTAVTAAQTEVQGAKARLDEAHRRSAELDAQPAQAFDTDGAVAALEQAQTDLTTLQDRLATEEAEVRLLGVCRQTLDRKGLPSMLLDTHVAQLGSFAAKYCSALTGDEITVEFSTTKTLKKGDTTESLEVIVKKRGGGGSYDDASGGEGRRADLCVAFALRDLARSRTDTTLGLAVFDECFEGLDPTGAEQVAALLREESRDGTALVITHDRSLVDHFDTVWCMQRETDKDSILVETQ